MQIIACIAAALLVSGFILYNLLDRDYCRAQRQWTFVADYFAQWVRLTRQLLDLLAPEGSLPRDGAQARLARWEVCARICTKGVPCINDLSAFTDDLLRAARPEADSPAGQLALDRWAIEEELETFTHVYNDIMTKYCARQRKPGFRLVSRLLRLAPGELLCFSSYRVPGTD